MRAAEVLKVFPSDLFRSLAAVATPNLKNCQAYEVTNLLWAFAEFYKQLCWSQEGLCLKDLGPSIGK